MDDDTEDYNYALEIFKIEEGREPKMNTREDMLIIAALQVGIRYARLKYTKFY